MNCTPVTLRKKLKAAGLDQNAARNPRPSVPKLRCDFTRYERYVNFRALFEYVYRLATEPVKFPARRRRKDRQFPKAA
ncbi:MAG TPA: hypothetical protein VFO27_11450 [Bryobacteraceae bacterium]|nr:hypothetical protein [Bryobacteraceae bacterium]